MKSVKVRFPPSPTGRLHLGGARTALFNYLFARRHGGKFVLRIEDTDKERSKQEYVEDIVESLRWLGINWDEGPYFQSKRIHIYKEYIVKLLKEKKAYYCFCSKEELENERQQQLVRGQSPVYSGKCRTLSEEEVEKNIKEGKSYVIRLKVEPKKISFQDIIRGEIKFDLALIGDFVIAKSETEPLYNLATPLDDHLMGITHIIRGEDHISNTPKQILIYKAFEWPLPKFAHLPLLLGEEQGKLSKRQGALSIRQYREEGFLPEALINFLALLGWHPPQDKEIISKEEMVRTFSLERVQKRGARLNYRKLIWLNRYYLMQKSPTELVKTAREFFEEYVEFFDEKVRFKTNKKIISLSKFCQLIQLGKERAETLKDILPTVSFFFQKIVYPKELLIWKNYPVEEIKNYLSLVKENLEKVKEEEFTKDKIKEVLEKISPDDKGLIYWPFRVALTGQKASPPPFEVAEILGKKETLQRIEIGLKLLEK